jgi:hypothetical protein
VVALWEPVVAEVLKVQVSDTPVHLAGQITRTTSWFTPLFKRNFEIVVQSGSVSEIKVRCDRKYVFFRYDPTIRYSVSPQAGACTLELVGHEGTRFELIQS